MPSPPPASDATPAAGHAPGQPHPANPPRPPAASPSPLSDGEWHRLHPLTPLFKGGFVLVVVIGIIIANLRDRLITIFLPTIVPEFPDDGDFDGDLIDVVIEFDLIALALLAVFVIVVLLVAWFYVSWRFHTFRITDDDVEVRSGILFRTQRRAPLDRVQGVNLTRPLFARLVGMAKLEVVGAGSDGNVKLEYLSTANAETVRADILRLASGARLTKRSTTDAVARSRGQAVSEAVSAGITGLIAGAEAPVTEPESVVSIPPGRLVGSNLLSGSAFWLLGMIIAVIVGAVYGTPWLLLAFIPAVLGFGAYWVSRILKELRYSIAPTPDGVRITFGLTTTITEILPPGRVHAVEVSQSILWRPFGWWRVRVNRLTGRSMTDTSADQFTTVLPVGLRGDVQRVLRLLLPGLDEHEWPLIFEHGILGPQPDDPYTNTPRRARIIRPLSWRRNGFLVSPHALLVRRGVVWRSLGIFPFARMQSFALHQGPVDRMLRVAYSRAHTVAGPIYGLLAAIDRDNALALFDEVARRSVHAASLDRSHRWAGKQEAEPETADAAGEDRTREP